MCKTYKTPKSETDVKVSVFSPVNPRQNVKKEDLPDRNDDSGWRKLSENIKYGQIHIKQCQICMRSFQSEHAYQIHIQKHKPECVHCLMKLSSWTQYLEHLPYCKKRAIYIPRRYIQTEKKPKLKFFTTSTYQQKLLPPFRFRCNSCY